MLRSWLSSQYLGHQNLKNALESPRCNVVLTSPEFGDHTDTTATGKGIGGFIVIGSTFAYRINDTIYIKGPEMFGTIIPHDATDNTASGGYDVTAKYCRAGALLIDADGTITSVLADSEAAVSVGGRERALGYLMAKLSEDDDGDKAIIAFFVVGDYTTAFVSTTTLRLGTAPTAGTSSIRVYSFGGTPHVNTPTAPVTPGVTYDGAQMLGLI